MKASEFGINGGWGGLELLLHLLTNLTQIQQTPRGQFYKDGQNGDQRHWELYGRICYSK
jgi:hypothetical protein